MRIAYLLGSSPFFTCVRRSGVDAGATGLARGDGGREPVVAPLSRKMRPLR